MLESAKLLRRLADTVEAPGDGEPCKLVACYGSFTLMRWGNRSRIAAMARSIRLHLRAHAPQERWMLLAQTLTGQAIVFAAGPGLTEEERKEYHSE